MKKQELQDMLNTAAAQGAAQALKTVRSNRGRSNQGQGAPAAPPTAPAPPASPPNKVQTNSRTRNVSESAQDDLDEALDTLEEIQKALDDGRVDRAQELADNILDEYDTDEDDV